MDEEGGVNHLHSVIDAIRQGDATERDPALSRTFVSHAMNAICFDAGDAFTVSQLKPVAELTRLPFPACWIEFKTKTRMIGALCVEASEGDRGIWVHPVAKCKDGWFTGSICFIDVSDLTYMTPDENPEEEWHTSCLKLVSSFLSAVNCTNVKRVESKPPAALNKARIRRGKQPLFSTWTLSISIPRERRDSVALGGSHASPRVHLRRGHPREYRPGLWTWVQPCAVGAKENGMIHKDYKAVVSKP